MLDVPELPGFAKLYVLLTNRVIDYKQVRISN